MRPGRTFHVRATGLCDFAFLLALFSAPASSKPPLLRFTPPFRAFLVIGSLFFGRLSAPPGALTLTKAHLLCQLAFFQNGLFCCRLEKQAVLAGRDLGVELERAIVIIHDVEVEDLFRVVYVTHRLVIILTGLQD